MWRNSRRSLEVVLFSLFFVLVINCYFVCAIRINEVELNPAGGKSGTEWVELYNDENKDVNISKWEIYDGLISPQKRFIINGETIIKENEYYIIEFDSSVLNNGGDFVTIYNSFEEKIYETSTLKESSSSSKTWQFCSDNWQFLESTKQKENSCAEEQEEQEETENENNKEENIESLSDKVYEIKPIYLNKKEAQQSAQDLKGFDDNKLLIEISYNTIIKYAIYFFILLLCITIYLKIRQKRFRREIE